ncbi:MAG: ester cyclase, partial [Gemmatimonadales bacterium]
TFMGIPATGRHVAIKGMVIDRVVDGKWKDSRILMDTLGLLQQLGALPPAPESGESEEFPQQHLVWSRLEWNGC